MAEPESPPNFGFQTHYLGSLNDEQSLAFAYAAADVFVAPSRQDNFPNTVLEALASGTPCVGFRVGGLPDQIEHQQTGYLAEPYDIQDLARGIDWVLSDPERYPILAAAARAKAEAEYGLEQQAKRYQVLFEELLKGA
jgi:glycosyltransferase involved in cell wall biosynthesis